MDLYEYLVPTCTVCLKADRLMSYTLLNCTLGPRQETSSPLLKTVFRHDYSQQDDRDQRDDSEEPLEREVDFVHGRYFSPCSLWR
jgi:hypothetical protein